MPPGPPRRDEPPQRDRGDTRFPAVDELDRCQSLRPAGGHRRSPSVEVGYLLRGFHGHRRANVKRAHVAGRGLPRARERGRLRLTPDGPTRGSGRRQGTHQRHAPRGGRPPRPPLPRPAFPRWPRPPGARAAKPKAARPKGPPDATRGDTPAPRRPSGRRPRHRPLAADGPHGQGAGGPRSASPGPPSTRNTTLHRLAGLTQAGCLSSKRTARR